MMPDYVTPSTRDSLQGDLAGVGLAELLLFLAQSQRSGRLEVRLRQNLGLALTLIGGRIAAVAGPLAPRLSDSLLTSGAPPQQVAAIGKALSQGKKLWELVVHFPVLRAVQEWRALCALLPWLHYQQGEFTFRAGPAAAAQGVEVPGLVLEATRRLDELGPAPDPLAVWSIPERPGDISAHLRELMPREWRVLSVIDGERPLAQAATQAVLPWDEFVRAVLRLESLGLLEARPAGVSKKHLVPGDPAPNFTLRALDGSAYSLGSRRGGKTLLAFFRHAGCPFCNFRLHQLIQAYPDLQAVGVEAVGVFGSPLETLRERAGRQRPSFPVLADPDDTVHNLYGTGNSLLGLLDPRGLGAYLRGLALGIPHGSVDGELLRMPAEFLIDEDLKVVRAHYGAHGGDRLSLQEVLAWGQAS